MNLAIMNNISDLRTEHVAARINMAKIKNALSAIGERPLLLLGLVLYFIVLLTLIIFYY